MGIKLLQTADWYLGTFKSPVKDGVNLRTEDTKRCLDEMIRVAKEEQPDYSLISGDVFHVGHLWSDRCCDEILTAVHYIKELAAVSKQVIVMRGTPNHDGIGPSLIVLTKDIILSNKSLENIVFLGNKGQCRKLQDYFGGF